MTVVVVACIVGLRIQFDIALACEQLVESVLAVSSAICRIASRQWQC